MKMLTGLLPPTEGTATLFGELVEAGSIEVRKKIGYMTQAFSLYGELTVRQNLVLDARLYHIPPAEAEQRIGELVKKFGLVLTWIRWPATCRWVCASGCRSRSPCFTNPLLILDEPTSGVDPVARDSFWELLIDLSRNQGVTIFVTTHFMNEAMRCDRISLMHSGRVLACDAPQKLIELRGSKSLEEAFILYMEDAIGAAAVGEKKQAIETAAADVTAGDKKQHLTGLSLRIGRMMAYSANETMQILRDPVRLAFAFVGSAVLMLVFGFGITTDVERVRYATFDQDRSLQSRAYLEQFSGTPRYFRQNARRQICGERIAASAGGRHISDCRDPAEFRAEPRERNTTRSAGSGRRRQHIPRRNGRAVCPGRPRQGAGRSRQRS